MITRVPLILFNSIYFIILIVGFVGCSGEQTGFSYHNVTNHDQDQQNYLLVKVNVNELLLKPEQGLVYYKDKPFSGVSLDHYDDGSLKESITYYNGKKHGDHLKFFIHGTVSYKANYVENKKHGEVATWWINGNKRSEFHFRNGNAEGKQYQWYQSGSKFKILNLINGREEGLQQSWRENGKIYNNYEAKNGRIFGLKRANLCYQLDEEQTITSNP